jgi:hypothetical protein
VRFFLHATHFFLILSLGSFVACGYKPSSHYARQVVGETVSTSVVISAKDPENTVIVKDAVDLAILKVFHASLRDKKHAQTHLKLSITEPRYTPIQYDANGFVIAYRATLYMNILRTTKTQTKHYKTVGNYDFSVVANAVLTDQERFNAIRYSAQKAISAFVAQVAAEGSR